MRLALIFLAVLFLSACAGPSMTIGRPIATQRLAELMAGVSSEKEVLAALGEPTGRGMWRWAGEQRPLDLCVYDFQRRHSSELEMAILIVFLKDGTYVGHYWFGANPLLQ